MYTPLCGDIMIVAVLLITCLREKCTRGLCTTSFVERLHHTYRKNSSLTQCLHHSMNLNVHEMTNKHRIKSTLSKDMYITIDLKLSIDIIRKLCA